MVTRTAFALVTVLALVALVAVVVGPAHAFAPDDPSPLRAHELTPEERAAASTRAFLLEVHAAYELVAYIEALKPKPVAPVREYPAAAPETAPARRTSSTSSSSSCGGDLPPCYVLERESGGDPTAENPVSTASGKWQFLDGTWAGFSGYAHASDAPAEVQDARARELWAGGAGCSHWDAC